MDTAAFLARVVPASGNYLTITWPPTPGDRKSWSVRSYKTTDGHAEAAGMIDWLTRKNTDVYYAVAAFTAATASTTKAGRRIDRAERKGPNVHSLRVLVIDADVARAGDGKDPSKVFPDRAAALAWVDDFAAKASFPRPNLVVDSGYGYHIYWVMRDAVAPDAWGMLSQALKAAIVAHGWPGDTGSTVDASRILRPPGAKNFKVPGDPKLVTAVDAWTAPDIVNDDMIAALAPYIATKRQGLRRAAGGGASVHKIGGGLGARPEFLPPGDQGAGLNAAAHAGVEKRAYHYKFIASRCRQAERTLTTGGRGESRDLWVLGGLTMLTHCADGEDYVHRISSGDPRYTEAETDDVWAQTRAEVDAKGLGAPLCTSLDGYRRGICQGCPHFGHINSPIVLGVDDDDLPWNYRRTTKGGTPCIEYKHNDEWIDVMWGDVRSPILDEFAPGGHQLGFTYILSGSRPVSIRGFDAGEAKTALLVALERQGISADRHTFPRIGDLIVAWINKLRAQRSVRIDKSRSFGWNFSSDGTRTGLAIAGDLYKADGTEERVPGGDPKIAQMYRPIGELAKWRQAAALFENGRADLQTLIACSFASPCVSLAGDVRGMSLNFWSTESGIGKSTAIKVGQSVWADYKALQSMKDTANHVMRSLSEPRFIIRYWDELRVRPTTQDEFNDLIFTIPQGKERGRLHADTTMREVGEWECLLAFTSNRSMQDYLVVRDDATDAGLARLFEVQMAREAIPFDARAGQVIKLTETNYGHAGRIFVKYLAANAAATQVKLNNLMAAFATHLNMQQEERFFVCAMACIMVGAATAKNLGLFNFDIDGIHKCLVSSFTAMREQRQRQVKTGPKGGYHVEDMLAEYCYAMADYRLRTREFAVQGLKKVDVVDPPRNERIAIHISQNDKLMRLARADLTAWLRDHQYPARSIVQQIVNELGALEVKRTMGGGTRYGGAQVWVLEIPLTGALEGLSHALGPLAGSTHVKTPRHNPTGTPRAAPGKAVNQGRM